MFSFVIFGVSSSSNFWGLVEISFDVEFSLIFESLLFVWFWFDEVFISSTNTFFSFSFSFLFSSILYLTSFKGWSLGISFFCPLINTSSSFFFFSSSSFFFFSSSSFFFFSSSSFFFFSSSSFFLFSSSSFIFLIKLIDF